MLKAIIVDDIPTNTSTLKALLDEFCPNVTVAAVAHSSEEAYRIILAHHPDIIFLDIEMPGKSGFDLLAKFHAHNFGIIFTTAFNQYAVNAFGVDAIDYLLKPINIERLQHAVLKAEQYLQQRSIPTTATSAPPAVVGVNKISIPVLDGYLFIDFTQLIRCEGVGSYSRFHFTDGNKILVSLRLKECEAILPSHLFFRIHNSHIINLKYVVKYIRGKGGYVQMEDGSHVEVSSAKKDNFFDMMKLGR